MKSNFAIRFLRLKLGRFKHAMMNMLQGIGDGARIHHFTAHPATPASPQQLEGKLWAHAHVLEKGLSLPNTRAGYGRDVATTLVGLCQTYEGQGGDTSSTVYCNAVAVLHAYVDFQEEVGSDVSFIKPHLPPLPAHPLQQPSGVQRYSREEYVSLAQKDFSTVAQTRSSLRIFGTESVSYNLIEKSLDLARKTPTACNRQSHRVYWARSKSLKESICRLQTGNRGFGEHIDSFLVITTDIQYYFGRLERHQTYVDGGLYAMNLLYALHYVGLGACSLNWSATNRANKALKELLHISSSENVIMLIGVGSLPDEIKVAVSARKTVAETLTVLE